MIYLVILGHLSIILSLIVNYINPEINIHIPMNIPFIIIGFMNELYIVTVLYMVIRFFRMFIIHRHRNQLISLLQHPTYFNA